jgi:hypothetical protein
MRENRRGRGMVKAAIPLEIDDTPSVEKAVVTKGKKRKAKARAKTGRKPSSRTVRPFPASSFDEPLQFAKEILAFGSGQPVRRLTFFDHIGKSPESGPSRQLITNANKYGLITGGYQADVLSLTAEGAKAADDSLSPRELVRARAKLAIEDIPSFKGLYDGLIGNKLPAKAALIDRIQEFGVSEDAAEEGVDTFIVNLRFVGLLRTLSGAERIVSVDHLLDSLPAIGGETFKTVAPPKEGAQSHDEKTDFDKTCFYITPIGSEGSDQRKHSDLFMGSLVEPALESFGLKVIRADGIDKPGVITRQVIEYILRSKIVIADLSFHNPNVFYELALRHATRLPIVQIMRRSEFVPFDVNQMRTVQIDTTDIYSLVPKIDLYRSEIANQVRRALENAESVDTPISVYFPSLKTSW